MALLRREQVFCGSSLWTPGSTPIHTEWQAEKSQDGRKLEFFDQACQRMRWHRAILGVVLVAVVLIVAMVNLAQGEVAPDGWRWRC